jgi:hypothetical protein
MLQLAQEGGQEASSIPPARTWLLKSQYGHLEAQNGQ